MTRAGAAALVQGLHAIWNTGDLAAIPAVYAPDFVAHFPKGWASLRATGTGMPVSPRR